MKKVSKYTEEYVHNVCMEKNLTLQKIDHEIINGKKRRMVYFICNKHEIIGVQKTVVDKIDSTKNPCKYCNNSVLSLKNIVAEKSPYINILSNCDNINTESRIFCECKTCGYQWSTVARALLSGTGCRNCFYKNLWDKRGRKTTDDIREKIKYISPNIDVVGGYNGSHEYIKCKCLIHNITWESIIANLCNGSARCPECGKDNIRNVSSLSDDDFNERLLTQYNHIVPIDKYVNRDTEIKFYCKTHDIEFCAKPKSFLYGKVRGCPLCTQSSGEIKMINILLSIGIDVKTQYMFDDCVYKNKLRSDAYDEHNKIAFEFQGRQHYEPVDFFGGDESFELNQIRDNIKRQYCKNNNIKLIEIPYWEFDNMESYILENIQ